MYILCSVTIEFDAVLVRPEHWWHVLYTGSRHFSGLTCISGVLPTKGCLLAVASYGVAVNILCTRTIAGHRRVRGNCYTDWSRPAKISFHKPGVREGISLLEDGT